MFGEQPLLLLAGAGTGFGVVEIDELAHDLGGRRGILGRLWAG